MAELYTTLRLLRRHKACLERYHHLARTLNFDYDFDKPITLLQILDINGVDDALWALRAVHDDCITAANRISRQFIYRICIGSSAWDMARCVIKAAARAAKLMVANLPATKRSAEVAVFIEQERIFHKRTFRELLSDRGVHAEFTKEEKSCQ